MKRLLRKKIAESGSQLAFARQHKISASYIQYLLSGEREFGKSICKILRARRILMYEVQDEIPGD